MYKNFFKRLIDVLISFLGLIILSPLFVFIFICLFYANNGYPFFIQSRPGKYGRLFNIVKFRTMTDKTDSSGKLLPDHQRLTTIGNFVRRTSLDEIPQLLNVLVGDMSLIGPRPLLPQYLPLYSEFQSCRHYVKPGITGWAQVNGRNTISWTKKFEYDVWYVNNLSFALDFKILVLTIKKVIKSEGISSSTSITMEGFTGKN